MPRYSSSLNGLGYIDEVLSDKTSLDQIDVFPNPTKDILQLSKSSAWVLTSLQGYKLGNGVGETVDLRNLNNGVYITTWFSNNTSCKK